MTETAGRVAVVTGASSGIGKETAKALAIQGWRVIAIGRDPGRTSAAEREIREAAPSAQVDMLRGDLALLADAKRLTDAISALTDRVHVLVNNAGGMARQQVITPEGFEENFTSNHLGPFLLTKRLLPLLRRAAANSPAGTVRIINTSSDASEMIPGIDWDDWQCLKQFRSGRAYCQAKLANVLFARGLSQRLAEDGILAFSVHPGVVDSNFVNHADASTQQYIATLASITPAEGADTVIWLATTNEPVENGGYYFKRQPKTPNPLANDATTVDRLWEESEKLLVQAGV